MQSIPAAHHDSFRQTPISKTNSETRIGGNTYFTDHRAQSGWDLSSNMDRSTIEAQRRKMEEADEEMFSL